jgi:hypothetical protein
MKADDVGRHFVPLSQFRNPYQLAPIVKSSRAAEADKLNLEYWRCKNRSLWEIYIVGPRTYAALTGTRTNFAMRRRELAPQAATGCMIFVVLDQPANRPLR